MSIHSIYKCDKYFIQLLCKYTKLQKDANFILTFRPKYVILYLQAKIIYSKTEYGGISYDAS